MSALNRPRTDSETARVFYTRAGASVPGHSGMFSLVVGAQSNEMTAATSAAVSEWAKRKGSKRDPAAAPDQRVAELAASIAAKSAELNRRLA